MVNTHNLINCDRLPFSPSLPVGGGGGGDSAFLGNGWKKPPEELQGPWARKRDYRALGQERGTTGPLGIRGGTKETREGWPLLTVETE